MVTLHDLVSYIPLLNIPVLILVIKISIKVGEYEYIMGRIKNMCCLMTLTCPIKGVKNGKTEIAPEG